MDPAPFLFPEVSQDTYTLTATLTNTFRAGLLAKSSRINSRKQHTVPEPQNGSQPLSISQDRRVSRADSRTQTSVLCRRMANDQSDVDQVQICPRSTPYRHPSQALFPCRFAADNLRLNSAAVSSVPHPPDIPTTACGLVYLALSRLLGVLLLYSYPGPVDPCIVYRMRAGYRLPNHARWLEVSKDQQA